MADHAVLRPDGEALDVPAAHHRLPGGRLGRSRRARAAPRRSGTAGSWWRRSSRPRRRATSASRDGVQALPRREHVEDDAVDVGRRSVVRRRGRRRSAARPGAGRRRTSRRCARAISAKSAPALVRDQTCRCSPTARSRQQDSAPEPAPASTTRAPGKMSAMRDDLRGVLGVDDGRAARHATARSRRAAAGSAGTRAAAGPDDDALGAADQLVVARRSPGGCGTACRPEGDGVDAALGVGQLDRVAGRQRPVPRFGHGAQSVR